jgi:hypothetical protein
VHVFRDLLVAAVEESDVWICGINDFAVQLENEAQHAVSRRMGRAHVQHHPLADEIIRFRMIVVRSTGGSGDGVGGLDFLGSVAHAGFAGEISAQNSPIRKGFVKIFTSVCDHRREWCPQWTLLGTALRPSPDQRLQTTGTSSDRAYKAGRRQMADEKFRKKSKRMLVGPIRAKSAGFTKNHWHFMTALLASTS